MNPVVFICNFQVISQIKSSLCKTTLLAVADDWMIQWDGVGILCSAVQTQNEWSWQLIVKQAMGKMGVQFIWNSI